MAKRKWGDPGVTEQLLVLEDAIAIPSTIGGVVTRTLQRAGYVRRLRMFLEAELEQTAAAVAPSISVYGAFAGMIRRLRIEAAGRQPVLVLSGLSTAIYNEIQNKDGSVLCPPAYGATFGIVAATPLMVYTAPGTAAQSYVIKYPIEYAFSLPVFVRGVAEELGLWLLQDRSIDLSVEVEWNNPFSIPASQNAAYSGQADLAGTPTVAATNLRIERDLYAVPPDEEARPNETWAHQVVEHEEVISGKKFRFNIPAAGLLLRVIVQVFDDSDDPVEYTDLQYLSVIYGTNTTPIRRAGWALTQEYLQDYGRYPPKGVAVLDFYKWGLDTLKLAKDSEGLANFRIEGNFVATTTGKVVIILDTLQRVLRQT